MVSFLNLLVLKPGGVVVKHRGLWSPRREFESLPGYYQNRYISISFLSQNEINLIVFTVFSSVTIELVVTTFKLSVQ